MACGVKLGQLLPLLVTSVNYSVIGSEGKSIKIIEWLLSSIRRFDPLTAGITE